MNRLIVLSAHLDDGILSCGGIASSLRESYDVAIWTIFAGAPRSGPYSAAAQWLHSVSSSTSATTLARVRRKEDLQACSIVGASAKHFGWHDAAYRKARNGTCLYEGFLGAGIHPEDRKLVTEIAAQLSKDILTTDTLIVPLGIGAHVDHVIVRQAAEGLENSKRLYYLDLPYASMFPEQAGVAVSGLKTRSVPLSTGDVSAWIDAASSYESQQRMLNDAVGDLRQLLASQASAGVNIYERNAH